MLVAFWYQYLIGMLKTSLMKSAHVIEKGINTSHEFSMSQSNALVPDKFLLAALHLISYDEMKWGRRLVIENPTWKDVSL